MKAGAAKAQAIADLEIEPRQQRRICRRAERAIAFGQHIGKLHLRSQRQLAQHRVGGINRLDFDQRQPPVPAAHHGRQRRRNRHLAARTEKRDFVRFGFALDQRECHVTAQQGAALARQPLAQAGCDRTDPGDRHHAERDAGDENIKAAQPAAQLSQRVPHGERCRRAATNRRGCGTHIAPLMY